MIYPHGSIETIGSDVFMVRGSIKMGRLLRISRNMGIVRHKGELSLINPIRLNTGGEAALRQLGEVKNIIRLGCFHGVDDPYYVEQFGARHWCQPGGEAYTQPTIDKELNAATQLPFPNAQLFFFQTTRQPECVLLLKTGGGLLFSCDAIQHYGNYSYNNLLTKLIMPFIGFPRRTIVGPFWLKLMTPEEGSLEQEFRELLQLDFDQLLSAHGTFLSAGAHASVSRAVDLAFAKS